MRNNLISVKERNLEFPVPERRFSKSFSTSRTFLSGLGVVKRIKTFDLRIDQISRWTKICDDVRPSSNHNTVRNCIGTAVFHKGGTSSYRISPTKFPASRMSSSASKLPTGSRRSLWRSVSNENQDVQGAAIVPRHLFGESSYDGDAKHLIDKGFPQRKAACLQPLQSNDIGGGQHGSLYRSISNDSEQSDADFDLLPLIKEELRNNIQKRRWQRGVLDLALEDYDKEKYQDDQLTPEEQAKREDRKNRNREAAARCRAKRRKHMEELEQSMVNLESRKNELIQQKEQLLREKRELEKMVDDHFRLCPCNNEMRGT